MVEKELLTYEEAVFLLKQIKKKSLEASEKPDYVFRIMYLGSFVDRLKTLPRKLTELEREWFKNNKPLFREGWPAYKRRSPLYKVNKKEDNV